MRRRGIILNLLNIAVIAVAAARAAGYVEHKPFVVAIVLAYAFATAKALFKPKYGRYYEKDVATELESKVWPVLLFFFAIVLIVNITSAVLDYPVITILLSIFYLPSEHYAVWCHDPLS